MKRKFIALQVVLLLSVAGVLMSGCSREERLEAPGGNEAPFSIVFTRSANPEDDVANARLIITNAAGTSVIYNVKKPDGGTDPDAVDFQLMLRTGAYNLYLFANELASWNLDAVNSVADIREKLVSFGTAPTVDATHTIPMFKAWEGVQLLANGTTTCNGVAVDFSATGNGAKVERMYAKVEVSAINCNYAADLNGVAISLDSLKMLHLPTTEYVMSRPYSGATFYDGGTVKTTAANYTQTAAGFTFNGTGSPFYVPEYVVSNVVHAAYLQLYCHLTGDPSTTFSYKLYIGDGLRSGFMPATTGKTVKELSITRNTNYKLTIAQIKGFGTMESATVYVDVQPWTSVSVDAALESNIMNLSGLLRTCAVCDLESREPWVLNWETNHEPRYIWYLDDCVQQSSGGGGGDDDDDDGPPGSGSGGGGGVGTGVRLWADKDTVVIVNPSCDHLLTVLAPWFLHSADNGATWDTLRVMDWFTPQFSSNIGPDSQGFYRGRIKLTPKATVPTAWAVGDLYRLFAGDDKIRLRELAMEIIDCPLEPLSPGLIYYPGICENLTSKVEESTTDNETVTGELPSGGDGTYSYEWQYSLDSGTTWQTVPANGTGQNYTPGAELAHGINYRRKVTDGQGTFGYSNSVQVFIVTPQTMPNVDAGSNKGRDFWLTFGKSNNSSNYTLSDIYLQLKIAAENTAHVHLAFTADNTADEDITVTGGSVYAKNLSDPQEVAVYNDVLATTTTNLSLHITSDEDIIVYAINLHSASSDATTVYPVGSLGTDYVHLSYKPTNTNNFDAALIVATENGTHIWQDSNGGTLLATLNAGDVYNHYAAEGANLTGTHFVTDKPVAYFANVTIAFVPSTHSSGDILYEQLFSTDRWGTHFFVPQTEQGKTRIRVLASQPGTTVDGSNFSVAAVTDGQGTTGQALPVSLNANQFTELECSVSDGCYIYANHPIAVMAYMVGNYYTMYPGDGQHGDPAMAWVPPIEQKARNVMIARFYSANSLVTNHRALIITETAGKDQTTVSVGGGAASLVSAVTWYDNASAGLSFCSYPLNTNSPYVFDNPNGLVITGYGYGNVETYSYLAGAASRILSASLMVNGSYSDEIAGDIYGSCTPITLECEASETPVSITWRINGTVQGAYNNMASWSASFPIDDYIIEMEAVIGTRTFTQITWFRVRCCTP
ncbi:MAG: hypothetical protein LBR06_07210 [Bacteroidales bacterium]|jgi:hypothetical protein|nr:hypothetical protein [Bacteroidales bacterium]